MKCSLMVALTFGFCAFAYGSSSAFVSEGMKYFTPNMIILLRMIFGCLTCFIIMVFRMIFEKNYKQVVYVHFTSGIWPIIHIIIGGLLNLGIPHTLIAIAQQWIPSAAVQLARPLTPISSAIVGHFLLPNEPFTKQTGIALVCSMFGVGLSAVPAFNHASDSGVTTSNMVVGYSLLVFGVFLFGLAAVYFRWKTPNADLTISCMIQTGSSALVDILWAEAINGHSLMMSNIKNCPPSGWIWPLILGIVASGFGVHCFLYLVNTLGPVGAGFIPFGQILVGVVLGVIWLGEWDSYTWVEIGLNMVGIIFLAAAIVVGFSNDKEKAERKEEEDVEEESSSSILDEL